MKKENWKNFSSLLCVGYLGYLACLESDDSSMFVFLGFLAIFFLFLVLVEKFTKKYKKEIEERPDVKPLYPEKVSAVKEEMKSIYAAAAFTFVLLVLFSIWAEYYPHGTFSFLNQYSEYFFLGGAVVIFLLVVFFRRRKEEGIIRGI